MPKALLWSVGASAVLGYINIVAVMFSIQACPPIAVPTLRSEYKTVHHTNRELYADLHIGEYALSRTCAGPQPAGPASHRCLASREGPRQSYSSRGAPPCDPELWADAGRTAFGIAVLQDPSTLMTGSAGGNVAAQVYVDAFMARFESGKGGLMIISANLLTCFFAAQCSVAANSRYFRPPTHLVAIYASCWLPNVMDPNKRTWAALRNNLPYCTCKGSSDPSKCKSPSPTYLDTQGYFKHASCHNKV